MTVDQDLSATVASLQECLARQAAELQQLRNEITLLSRHDLLTGAINQRTLHEWLAAELIRSHRTGHPFCYAIVDIDHFGALNRQYGHAAGDEVLKTFSNAAVKLLRALDRFGRIDADTFGIVLPATWLDSGIIALNRLRAAVDVCPWTTIVPGTGVTFSAGLTTNAPGDTPEKIVARALQGMQQARENGHNCTITIEDALPDMSMIDD
jgi:diguanylate cyclase (GGDEF)-like protein